MEKEESTSKRRKNKAQLGINIGGLVVFGGALAVTSLIAAFAFKGRRRSRNPGKDSLLCKKEDKASQGLRFILQNSSSNFRRNPCFAGHVSTGMAEETQIDSCVSTESMILEENSASMIQGKNEKFANDDQEILITDEPKQESIITPCDCLCCIEEIPLPIASNYDVGDNIENDSKENSSWMERIEVRREEKEMDTGGILAEISTPSVNLVEEDEEEQEKVGEEEEGEDEDRDSNEGYVMEEEAISSETQATEDVEESGGDSGEEEEEKDGEEEYVVDKGDDESTEETGSTSNGSNTEAIWPAESLVSLSLELKDMEMNMVSSEEKFVEEGKGKSTRAEEIEDSTEALQLEVLKNIPVNLQTSEEEIVEEDRSTETEEYFDNDFNDCQSNKLNNVAYDHSLSSKEKEMPQLVEVNDQIAEWRKRKKIWVWSMSLVALLLLLLVTHRNVVNRSNCFFIDG